MAKGKRICFICGLFMLAIFGCGKKKEEKVADRSVMSVNRCFTRDGMVQINVSSFTGKVDYFDYKTKTYRPLCGVPNCLHDSVECFAVYLNKYTWLIGRLGDKWYYQKSLPDGGGVFCCSDLNGENEKEIGEFSHGTAGGTALFLDHYLLTATHDWFIDEETGEVSEKGKCSIYRYDFETGKEEALVPEREGVIDVYRLYGCYENLLVYLEQGETEESWWELNILDMESGTVTKPLGEKRLWVAADYAIDGSTLVCNVKEGDSRKVIELNVKSGEWKELPQEVENFAAIFWTPKLKLLTFWEEEAGGWKTYQYGEDEEPVLVREDGEYPWFQPLSMADDLLVGRYGEEMVSREDGFELAIIPTEDYLAGKNNFTLLMY
ncbi:MAG: hypothetical protein HFI67_04300 [Lachnospiraceae bacterium]|nr:hypothetical protein [Lachnospiraceae bacterium]